MTQPAAPSEPPAGRKSPRLLWALCTLPMAGLAGLCAAWPRSDGHVLQAWVSAACVGVAGIFWVMGLHLRVSDSPTHPAAGDDPDRPGAVVPLSRGRRLAVVCHGVMLIVLVWVARFTPVGLAYLIALGAGALLLACEHFVAVPGGRLDRPVTLLRLNLVIPTLLLAGAAVDLAFNLRHHVSDATWRWFL